MNEKKLINPNFWRMFFSLFPGLLVNLFLNLMPDFPSNLIEGQIWPLIWEVRSRIIEGKINGK